MGVQRYIARRLTLLVPVLFGVSVLTFILSHIVPGDPARLASGFEAPEEQVQRLRRELGLDQPLPVQYGRYVGRLLRGDLGVSVINRRPVRESLAAFFPATLELSLASMAIALAVGIPLGVLAAAHRDGPLDYLSRLAALLGVAFPVFWVAIVLVLIFYFVLGWFPSGGRVDPNLILRAPVRPVTGFLTLDAALGGNWRVLADALWHLALPAASLSLSTLARVVRMTRANMVEVLGEPYITTARAKGLAARRVTYGHALRNAMIPTLTVVGIAFGYLLGGAVLVETIFAYPGVGKYAFDAIVFLDFPAIMGITLLATAVFLTVNLLVDILYVQLDPRIRFE